MKKVLFWTIMTLMTACSILAYMFMILSYSIINRILSFLPCIMFCSVTVLMILAKEFNINKENNNEVQKTKI